MVHSRAGELKPTKLISHTLANPRTASTALMNNKEILEPKEYTNENNRTFDVGGAADFDPVR